MANIAEGYARRSNKEFTQFLFISKSSAAEVQSQLYVAVDQGYIDDKQFEKIYNQAEKVSKLNSGFIKYLKTTLNKPHKPSAR
jgi:four helix bundle protein